MERVFRVQDGEGRGPFRPGFSKQWLDATFFPGMKPLPTWMDEFGTERIVRLARGRHLGCGVRELRHIGRWFSPTERIRLKFLGFSIISIEPEEILAESPNQLVFAVSNPLSTYHEKLSWF